MTVFDQFLTVIQKVGEWIPAMFGSAAAYTALAAFLEFIRKFVGNIR